MPAAPVCGHPPTHPPRMFSLSWLVLCFDWTAPIRSVSCKAQRSERLGAKGNTQAGVGAGAVSPARHLPLSTSACPALGTMCFGFLHLACNRCTVQANAQQEEGRSRIGRGVNVHASTQECGVLGDQRKEGREGDSSSSGEEWGAWAPNRAARAGGGGACKYANHPERAGQKRMGK